MMTSLGMERDGDSFEGFAALSKEKPFRLAAGPILQTARAYVRRNYPHSEPELLEADLMYRTRFVTQATKTHHLEYRRWA